jgi:hypothetical protein
MTRLRTWSWTWTWTWTLTWSLTATATATWSSACTCDDPAPTGEDTGPAVTGPSAEGQPLRNYFPLAAGDRWRYRQDPGLIRHEGVSGVESGGAAVILGTDHSMIERYRAGDGEIALVDPAGAVLVPVLRAPLRRGARWTYRAGAPLPGDCETTITASDARDEVDGVDFERCVELERTCTYQAGPGPRELSTRERYCPGVGLTWQSMTIDPPPPNGVPEIRETLRTWRIAGAPVPPPDGRFDCGDVILLPTDVRAACHGELRPQGLGSGAGTGTACNYEYSGPNGTVRITVFRPETPPTDEDVERTVRRGQAADAEVRIEGDLRVLQSSDRVRTAARSEDSIFLIDVSPAACAAEGPARLVPLLRSLVRP